MSLNPSNSSASIKRKKQLSYDLFALFGLVFFLGAVWLILPSAVRPSLEALLGRIFLSASQQVTWFITRAAGIIAYLLLWLSMVWGLAIPSKFFERSHLSGDFIFDFHQFLSLLSLGFLGLHIFILSADRYLPFTFTQILVPFLSPYRPVWVGIGTLAFYLLGLVTVTFYLRKRIGMKAFRAIHVTSLVAYLGAVAHAFMAGTDSSLPVILLLYVSTFLVVLFLTIYWLAGLVWNRLTHEPRATQPDPYLQGKRG